MPTQNMSQNFNYLRWINSCREKINNVVIQKEVKVWVVKEYPPYDMPKNSVFKFQASANDIYLKMRRKFVSVRQTAVDYM